VYLYYVPSPCTLNNACVFMFRLLTLAVVRGTTVAEGRGLRRIAWRRGGGGDYLLYPSLDDYKDTHPKHFMYGRNQQS